MYEIYAVLCRLYNSETDIKNTDSLAYILTDNTAH